MCIRTGKCRRRGLVRPSALTRRCEGELELARPPHQPTLASAIQHSSAASRSITPYPAPKSHHVLCWDLLFCVQTRPLCSLNAPRSILNYNYNTFGHRDGTIVRHTLHLSRLNARVSRAACPVPRETQLRQRMASTNV